MTVISSQPFELNDSLLETKDLAKDAIRRKRLVQFFAAFSDPSIISCRYEPGEEARKRGEKNWLALEKWRKALPEEARGRIMITRSSRR